MSDALTDEQRDEMLRLRREAFDECGMFGFDTTDDAWEDGYETAFARYAALRRIHDEIRMENDRLRALLTAPPDDDEINEVLDANPGLLTRTYAADVLAAFVAVRARKIGGDTDG